MGAQNVNAVDPHAKQGPKRLNGSWLLFVLPVLIILLFITGILLGTRLYDAATRDQNAVQLNIGEVGTLDLFQIEYRSETGDITVWGSGSEDVIAPGTQVDYDVRLVNDDDTNIDYVLAADSSFLTSDVVPVEVRLTDPYGNYLIGSEDEWAPVEELAGFEHLGVVRQGEVATYGFSWRWDFERGDDPYDTYLGNSNTSVPGVKVSFTTTSSASTVLPHTQGGMIHGMSDWGCCICCFLVWLLLVVCIVLLVCVWRQHRTIMRLNDASKAGAVE